MNLQQDEPLLLFMEYGSQVKLLIRMEEEFKTIVPSSLINMLQVNSGKLRRLSLKLTEKMNTLLKKNIVVFGSFARLEAHTYSDLDFYIILDKKPKNTKKFEKDFENLINIIKKDLFLNVDNHYYKFENKEIKIDDIEKRSPVITISKIKNICEEIKPFLKNRKEKFKKIVSTVGKFEKLESEDEIIAEKINFITRLVTESLWLDPVSDICNKVSEILRDCIFLGTSKDKSANNTNFINLIMDHVDLLKNYFYQDILKEKGNDIYKVIDLYKYSKIIVMRNFFLRSFYLALIILKLLELTDNKIFQVDYYKNIRELVTSNPFSRFSNSFKSLEKIVRNPDNYERKLIINHPKRIGERIRSEGKKIIGDSEILEKYENLKMENEVDEVVGLLLVLFHSLLERYFSCITEIRNNKSEWEQKSGINIIVPKLIKNNPKINLPESYEKFKKKVENLEKNWKCIFDFIKLIPSSTSEFFDEIYNRIENCNLSD